MLQLALTLDPGRPLNRGVYEALRKAILQRSVPAGGRLPSSRALAEALHVSRNTVVFAYDQLAAEGYVETRRGAGTFVVPTIPMPPSGSRLPAAGARESPRLSTIGARLTRGGSETDRTPLAQVPYDLRPAGSGHDPQTLGALARLLARRARSLSHELPPYRPAGGFPALREALAAYLARARGLHCTPDQIFVTQGSHQGIDLCLRLLVDPGDSVVLEDPHYTGYAHCLEAYGARVSHLPVDSQGMRVERLDDLKGASVVCVTPSHQFPSGGVMPLARRLRLIGWAARYRATILEDDYDGEFRYEGRPIECLYSLDSDGHVIYLGSASRILLPALRVGWAVVPTALVGAFRQLKTISDSDTPSLEQLALADFINEGHLERHVRRTRKRNVRRRSALLEALSRELGQRADVAGASAGMHVLLRLRELRPGAFDPLRQACLSRGVRIYSAGPNYANPPPHLELLVGYASLPEPDIAIAVSMLREALDSLVARRADPAP